MSCKDENNWLNMLNIGEINEWRCVELHMERETGNRGHNHLHNVLMAD